MSTPANLVIVTLGVGDLARSIDFYRALGWEQRGDADAGITWFRTSGTWVGLFGHADLAADVGLVPDPPPVFRGVTLALNVNSREEVDSALAHAVGVGARLVKEPEVMEWGGYSGYFADPDGHLWEVAHNPFFPVAEDGTIDIPA
ncbi:VOC family protein [Georgenia sp. Z1344]|uniref:VOC family protein n=1 Tax=Georgenia sp. Z1344 TaxID=3416706 RepID=UPI003CF02E28